MAEVKKARLFLRRGTDTDRKTTTLCQGELGYSTDAFRVFVGDGSTAGGKTVGNFVYVSGGSLGAHFHTNLTTASANGRAHKGDIAIFPAQSYFKADGTTSVTPHASASTVMILTADITADGSEAATPSSWVAVNSGIPFGNIDVFDDDISGNYVSGGIISAPITLSGGDINIGGNGTSENLILSGVALSAHTSINTTNWASDKLVYPIGLTHTGAVTCVNSILDFGEPTTSSGLGNPGGYIHANPASVSDHISAYALTTAAYNFGTTTSQGVSSNGVQNTSGITTFNEYIKSGGTYATGAATAIIPDGWSYTGGMGGKCGILELVIQESHLQAATGAGSLTLAQIQEFYFTVFYTHWDDASAFVGYHDHLTNQNVIADWNGSSISDGKMRAVPHVNQVCIPNTVKTGDNAASNALVLHLGAAAYAKMAIVFNGLRVNVG